MRMRGRRVALYYRCGCRYCGHERGFRAYEKREAQKEIEEQLEGEDSNEAIDT